MLKDLQCTLTERERAFLLSLAKAEPEWDRLEIPHARELLALRWKLENLKLLAERNPKKFLSQAQYLEALLAASA